MGYNGMTTHEEWVIKCPHCQRAYDLFWVSSGNNFGGQLWSDGCTASPCSYPLTGLQFCDTCRCVFTMGDCERIAPNDPSVEAWRASNRHWLPKTEHSGRKRRKRYAGTVTLAKCASLLRVHRWTKGRDYEPILRLGCWWNDEIKDRKQALSIGDALVATDEAAPSLPEGAVDNMTRLIDILPMEAGNALLLGDIHRRLGNFDAAAAAYGRMPSYRTALRDLMIVLTQQTYRSVVRLT